MVIVRDYRQWHQQYDDPESSISWRLGVVRRLVADHLDRHDGPQRVLSLCAGDGRDVIGALRSRPDARRVSATLVEIDPEIAAWAQAAAGDLDVDVRVADAGDVSCYADVVPADLVLLVGIFGNIAPEDIAHTVQAAAGLCRSGGTVLWSRSRERGDRNDEIRGWFGAAGFVELAYETRENGVLPSVGAMRLDGPGRALDPAEKLFTFIR